MLMFKYVKVSVIFQVYYEIVASEWSDKCKNIAFSLKMFYQRQLTIDCFRLQNLYLNRKKKNCSTIHKWFEMKCLAPILPVMLSFNQDSTLFKRDGKKWLSVILSGFLFCWCFLASLVVMALHSDHTSGEDGGGCESNSLSNPPPHPPPPPPPRNLFFLNLFWHPLC